MALSAEKQIRERIMAADLVGWSGFYRLQFHAMGTVNEIVFGANRSARARDFRTDAAAWLAAFEARYSIFLADSLISEINRHAGGPPVAVDDMTAELLAICHWGHWTTRGLFDATAGPLVHLWDYHRAHAALPEPDELARVRELVGWEKVEHGGGMVRLPVPGMQLNLGGIGKEYAVDTMVRLAADAGIDNILVSFGRDIRVSGRSPEGGSWRIGLERPDRPERCWGGVGLQDMAICCSGHYARFFELNGRRYSHLIDPRTGRPSSASCEAVWVLAPTCVQAGLLSTAAALLERWEALQLIGENFKASGCYWTKGARYETRTFGCYLIQNKVPATTGLSTHHDCAVAGARPVR